MFQCGTDHAGIATKCYLKKLLSEGITRHELGREKILNRVWDWKTSMEAPSNLSKKWGSLQIGIDPDSLWMKVYQKLYARFHYNYKDNI